MAHYTQAKRYRLFEGYRTEKNAKGNTVVKSIRREKPLEALPRKLVRVHPQMPHDTLVAPGQLINIKREYARQSPKPSWIKRLSRRSMAK